MRHFMAIYSLVAGLFLNINLLKIENMRSSQILTIITFISKVIGFSLSCIMDIFTAGRDWSICMHPDARFTEGSACAIFLFFSFYVNSN